MSKVFVRQKTVVLALVILFLLMVCVGLLVAVLKGQMHHENTLSSVKSSSRVSVTTASSSTSDHTSASTTRQAITRSTNDLQSTTEADLILGKATWEHFRLPRHVVPVHYDLLLHPNLGNDTFRGRVNITVNVTKVTRYFILHSYKLLLRSCKVLRQGTEDLLDIKRTFLYDPNEFFVVELEDGAEPGLYSIHIAFSGSLVGSIVGFYKSRYTQSSTNETRYLATSKFQPTYARRAFPCFDEPSFKSTFNVSLVHESHLIALSNMPAQMTESYEDGDLKVTKFKKSVPMVTYLACFIVCDFKYKETLTKEGKKFRVYATEEQLNKTEYALQFGSRVLEYFEDYFGIAYPLPKQDMVAIPDFVSGAMEHWGVITFRETNLLYDHVKSSPQNKQRVSTVISHEMAHMWFGNLVTMEWWDDLWLNEGFASYVEYKGVNDQHPQWGMLDSFVTEDMQSVMNLDSTMSSHPIVQPVSHPDEITAIFDGISYNKGASVLRMLEFFTGEENFRDGISRFLKKYQFKNARTGDLWEELGIGYDNQMGKNISTIMDTWTKQMGFPYVTVIRDTTNASMFSAVQKRFVKNPDLYQQTKVHENEYIWSVPLSYITAKGRTGTVWLHDGNTSNFTVPASDTEWVKFNVNQTGYYIVNYEESEWKRIMGLLNTNHEILSPSDRSNLLFDTSLLAEAGHINYDLLLSMTMYLKNETHLFPWETAYASLVYLSQLLEFTDVSFLMKSYIKEITKPLYDKLGWKEGDGHLNNLLRTTIIGLACHSGNQDCLNEASELLQNWTQGQQIPTSLRSLVYHYGMAEIGREEHWNYMWEKYLVEDSPQEKNALLYGLAHVRMPALIHRYLEFAMDETKIRRQDFFSILSYIAGNPIGRPIVWNFLREKWKYLVDRFTLNDRYLGFAVNKICSYFTVDFELDEMKSFFKKYPEAGAGKRGREQALEKVQNSIKWLQTHKKDVKLWLQRDGIRAWLYYRLPTHIIPVHYDLTLQPLLNDSKFKGNVKITVKLEKATDIILVHSKQLDIIVTEVTSHDHSKVNITNTFHHDPNDYWVMQTSEQLPVGQYYLYFEFNGNLTSSLIGFYKSSYIDPESNEERFLATSQFQSTYARRAFPCFDEPVFKSTFSVNIIHEPEYLALSNTMEQETIQHENGLLETKFEKSVPMVTYLVCIIVCDFKYKEIYTENGIRFRVYASPHNINKTDYALKIGSEVLTFFERYFDVPYPLQKQDMIAIPDFRAGAMENWGLITYRERRMLIDETETSIAEKIAAAYTIVHELAHMWFGNLVTMKWWDDLWLNEGFASYMEYKGIEHVEPTWDAMEQIAAEQLYVALTLDGEVNSHPVVQAVHNPNEISELFDIISYSKGSSVLRMLESLMGDDFRKGISSYLKKYAFSNADTQDLWAELTSASQQGLNITRIMDTWTRQMNYPYVSIKRNLNDPTKFLIKQQHFLSEPESKITGLKHSRFGYVWQIPLTYSTAEDPGNHFQLLNSTEEVELTVQNSEWVKFNLNFTGFFLVNYDEEDWRKFTAILLSNHNVFSPSNRANLLYDSFALARAGHISYDIPLQMTFYLRNETHVVPWKTARNMLRQINSILDQDSDDTHDMFKEHIRMLTRDHLRRLQLNDTGEHLQRRFRVLIVEVACKSGNFECLQATSTELKEWIKGKVLSPNLRSVVYFFGMQQNSDEDTWTFLWQKYLNETSSQEKSKLMAGLANTRNETLLRRLLEYATDESKVRRQDYFSFLSSISRNPLGHHVVWEFITGNWTSLVERFTLNDRGLGRIIKTVGSRFQTEGYLKKVQSFFRLHPKAGAGRRSRAETIEIIRSNIKWIQKYKTKVHDWLNREVFMPWKNIRLPAHIIPFSYDIMIHPNTSLGTFKGKVAMLFKATEPTDYVLIHSDQLTISESKLSESSRTIPLQEKFPFEKNHFWIIRLNETLYKTKNYTLELDFIGKMQKGDPGLMKLSYTNENTKEKRDFAVTLFQPTFARKVFPCLDEPGMKAKFTITIVHEPGYFVVSNMPEEHTETRPDNLLQTKFIESVPMVTYLVCFLVSDFAYTETKMSENRQVRIFAPPDRINRTLHALDFIPEMVSTFEDYFDIPYALPKLDFAAIPGYPALAMENWGLIMHLEDRLLPKGQMRTRELVSQIDQVVAHEIAHQWFGNLVTMKWWNDLWLNEGFATFAMFEAVRELHSFADEIAVEGIGRMMNHDATANSHPIVHIVNNPDEITQLFDDISYRKGLAILRMLRYIMKDDFREGVSMYLKKHQFGNAETIDLCNELSYASKMPINITEVMNTWTYQMGFPYIEIEISNNSFTATQERFLLPNSNKIEATEMEVSPYGYLWKIPIICKDLKTGKEEGFWLHEKKATFIMQTSSDAILNFNPEYFGYYLINYDENGWESLSRHLNENYTIFNVLDRYNLLHNAFMLAEGGKLMYDIVLDLTKYLKNEKEEMLWKLATKQFISMRDNLIEHSETYTLWVKYVSDLTDQKFNDILWNGQNNSDIDLRIAVLSCKSYSKKCLQKSNEFFNEKQLGKINFTLGLENELYRIASWHHGDEILWENTLKEIMENYDTKKDENHLAVVLANIQSQDLAKRSLDFTLENSNISSTFFVVLIHEMIYNPAVNTVVLDFLHTKWEKLASKFEYNSFQIISVLREVCAVLLKTEEDIKMVIQIFMNHTVIDENFKKRCLDLAQKNIDWRKKHKQSIADWLRWNVQ